MTHDFQRISEGRCLPDSEGRDTFRKREQLISGFNDLPSNHSFDSSLQMSSDGQLDFAPLSDHRLASSVINEGLFREVNRGSFVDGGPGEVNRESERASVDGLFSKLADHAEVRAVDARFAERGSGGMLRRITGDRREHSESSGKGGDETESQGSRRGVQRLVEAMEGLDRTIATSFSGTADGGISALASALELQQQMLEDPDLKQHAQLDRSILALNKQLAGLLAQLPGGEQLFTELLSIERQALAAIGSGDLPPPVESPAGPCPAPEPAPTEPKPTPEPAPEPRPVPKPTPVPEPSPEPQPKPQPNPVDGTDLSTVFRRGDSGVTQDEFQHAVDVANALPEEMKQTLLANGISMSVRSGFDGGAQGQNNGISGEFYADSGLSDQAEVHELYEMYGQLSNGGPGSWSDNRAVALADAGMRAVGNSVYYEGDLNDTVGDLKGDGDHLSNAFTADFFATHPGLNRDSYGQSTLSRTVQDDPALTAYIAQALGLVDAATV